MQFFFRKYHRIIFYAAWVILGLIQARFTELQDDEAYYWVFSKYPAWGYFDHPPLIALLIKMGYAIFPNELGVRLFPLLLNVLSLVLAERLIINKNPRLFYAIALSIAALQLGGILAAPDIPLIFFTGLFFLCYKKFLIASSWLNSMLLALSIAAMFYTKYHAALVILFTLLSNLSLFKNPRFYFSCLFALIVFLPHLLWQWEHNWISFRYHLLESNIHPWNLSLTADYLIGQILIAGPLAGIILLPAAFLFRPETTTEKAMKWTLTSVYIFFLLSSFRGRVETNWTCVVSVPLIVLSHQYLAEKPVWGKWLLRLLPVTLLFVVCMRIAMIRDVFPVALIQQRCHAWKKWPQQMKQLTDGLPVVFSNSYQRASKYWFYTGQMTYSQNDITGHLNNYNFWPIEDVLIGRPVYFIDIYHLNRFPDSLNTPIGYVGYRYDSSFLSFGTFPVPFFGKQRIREEDSLRIFYGGASIAGKPQLGYLTKRPQSTYRVNLVFFQGKRVIKEIPVSLNMNRIFEKSGNLFFTVKPNLPKGRYQIMLSFAVPGYNSTHNSKKLNLEID
jgi:hypothetical protein